MSSINLLFKFMCFIKLAVNNSRCLISEADLSTINQDQIEPFPQNKKNFANSFQFYFDPLSPQNSFNHQFFYKLLNNMVANSASLMKLQEQMSLQDQCLDDAFEELRQKRPLQTNIKTNLTQSWKSKDKIVQRVFGTKQYKYKLKLKHRLTNTIFKERNISLVLELVDAHSEKTLNSNMINLCVAACQTDGKWIPENQKGEYFIQGKTEVELYHGQASFHKIYPRDVSRYFKNGKINLVIYSRPSLIKFSACASSLQATVNSEEIEPLILKDITIRAKKKNTC